MMHIFLNALGASAGAGLTYLYNVIPHLSAVGGVRTTLAVQAHLSAQFSACQNLDCVMIPNTLGTARRFWFEQRELPAIVRKSGADVVISAGNFALRQSPVPQILLSGNSLYTSPHFYRDLRDRGEYGLWLDTRLKGIFAQKSVHWAQCTVAPSRAFATELYRWTNKQVAAIHHGFDRETFFRASSPLPPDVQAKMHSGRAAVRLLFVSHYNYYRNFETLLRAIPLLRNKLKRPIQLFLTCKLQEGQNPGAYKPNVAAKLIEQLHIRDQVVELGAIPYSLLHQVYAACHAYVTPAYTETFAHPLVEAMASGLPVVASDLPVHREVCEEAALYFSCFSPESLADAVALVTSSTDLAQELSANGRQRSAQFSWDRHVQQLLELASAMSSQTARHLGAAA
jgi:glycosyltransferase involved in cell wall biosynthesis